MARLTKRFVEAASPGADRYIVWDSDLKGFGLRVEPSGVRTFVVRYRVGGGRRGTRRQFKVGRYGALTPDQARSRAAEILAQVELGEDPQGIRLQAREVLSVAELCDVYLAEGCATKKESTRALDRIRIAVIKSLIGSRKATELTGADVERMRDAIASGRLKRSAIGEEPQASKAVKAPGQRARGGRTAATKAVKLLRAIYRWAIEKKRLPPGAENPGSGVQTFADGRRERFLSASELARLGDVLAAAETEPDPKARRASHVQIIRLLALTGARKNEIARLRWSEVCDGYLQLEDSKTGRKVIPLGAPAQEVLADLPRGNSAWVFPDPEDPTVPIRNLDWAWNRLRKAAGLADVRIHDLRHSFASVGVAGGASLFLVGKVLGHAHVATTQRYSHLADDPIRAAADRISSAISAALTTSSKPADDAAA